MSDIRAPRNQGESRHKLISPPMTSMPTQSIGHLFTKMKSTVKKHQENIPERERQIRMAIEIRFARSRANREFVYGQDAHSSRDSTHSSEVEEYQNLKGLKYYNLSEQNKKTKKQGIQKYESVKNGMKKFKINNNHSGLIRRTEGDEEYPKRVLSNERTLSNDSPVFLGNKYLFKTNKSKGKQKRKVNLSEQVDKYRTLGVPYLQKSKQYVRYAHKVVKSKQQLSRDSSSSENGNLLKSNLTLQVEFKKKFNGQNTSMHFKNISSSTRMVPKMAQDKSRHKVASTSTGRMQKTDDKLLKFLFSTKRF